MPMNVVKPTANNEGGVAVANQNDDGVHLLNLNLTKTMMMVCTSAKSNIDILLTPIPIGYHLMIGTTINRM